MDLPLISIVTPVYNGAKYILETIESVTNQGYPNIEHIIVDGGSNDGTHEILESCRGDKCRVIIEKDEGMYDAISKGFRIAKGDVFAYLNSDDRYMPSAIEIVMETFNQFPNVDWLTGVPSTMDHKGALLNVENPKIYPRWMIRKGCFRHDCLGSIQQESTFFRRTLYEKAPLTSDFKLAGDFKLWWDFAGHTQLFTVKTILASFRKHEGQLSGNEQAYLAECDKIKRKPLIFGLKNLIMLYLMANRKYMVKPTDYML